MPSKGSIVAPVVTSPGGEAPRPAPPRRWFRWTAFILGVTALGAAIPTPLYPIYESRFGFSAGVLGLVFAAYALGVLVVLFVLAPRAEAIGRRRVLLFGMGMTALSAAIFVVADGVALLALARAVTGLGVGATTSVATAAMSDLEPNRDQHHVARVAVAANFGAFAIGVGASGLLVQYAPYPESLPYVLPIVASAVGALALRWMPETAPRLGERVRWRVQRISVPATIRQPFWVAAGGIAACYAIYGFFAALVPSYVRSGLGLSAPTAAGAIVALMFGTAAVVQLATAEIRDRRALLAGFPLLLAALVGLVLILPIGSWGLLAVVTLGLGAAVGLTYMGSTTLADRVCSEGDRGEILAGFYSAGYLAVSIPTIGIAVLSGVVGLSDAGVLLGAVVAVLVVALYVEAYRTPTPPGGGGRPRVPAPSASDRWRA